MERPGERARATQGPGAGPAEGAGRAALQGPRQGEEPRAREAGEKGKSCRKTSAFNLERVRGVLHNDSGLGCSVIRKLDFFITNLKF